MKSDTTDWWYEDRLMTFGACRTSCGGAVIEDNVQGGNEDVTLTEGDIADEKITIRILSSRSS